MKTSATNFKDKFIAYADVLGFKSMIEAAESGTQRPLTEIRSLLAELRRSKSKEFYKQHGPQICPESACLQKDLDFEITQFSDGVVVSSEISPAGVINLIQHCWGVAMTLLTNGVLVRGYITRGKIYHSGDDFYGTGYHEALQREVGVKAFRRELDEEGTPFIEIDPQIVRYVEESTDTCVRDMFKRMVKRDGDLAAIFPFQVLSHDFALGGYGLPPFDAEKEKKNNNTMRQIITDLRSRVLEYIDPDNEKAMRKARHYVAALNEQLMACDNTDEVIDSLGQPFLRPLK